MTTTQPFTTSSGDYLSVLLSLWIPRYGWTIILPIAICAAVGFVYDPRFLLIALMLLFIVVPMLMSFLYTYYMLTPEARRAVIRKQVEIDENNFIRLIYLSDEKKENAESGKSVAQRTLLPIASEEERAPLPPLPVPDPETIKWSEILSVRSTSRFRVYILKGSRLTFLLIPWDAFRPASATSCSD